MHKNLHHGAIYNIDKLKHIMREYTEKWALYDVIHVNILDFFRYMYKCM